MRRLFLVLLLGMFLLGLTAQTALAVAPLSKRFLETYKDSKIIEAAKQAKCSVCHYGKSKKNRNDYGEALSEFFTKADYKKLKGDKDKLKAALDSALKKAEAEKSVSGETFGDLIAAGKLPGTAPPEEPEEPKE